MVQEIMNGDRVQVILKGSILQRQPNLAREQLFGRIENVPQHPNSWFTVRLEIDNSITKLQRPAIQIAESESGDTSRNQYGASLLPMQIVQNAIQAILNA